MRSRFGLPFVLVAGLAIGPAPSVRAGVPAPMSTLDDVVVGDMTGNAIQSTNTCFARQPGFNVVVRDFLNMPVPGALVMLDFTNSLTIRLAAAQNSGTTVNCAARTLTRIADANGAVRFAPRFGGYDNLGHVLVVADGVILASVKARSTDIDGFGGTAGLSDFALFAANFAAQAPTPETNFDDCQSGSIGTALPDFAIFVSEFRLSAVGAYCP